MAALPLLYDGSQLLHWCRAFKTVVFVIDQLESFVKAAKQTLLYNMLDALTGSQVQVRE